MFKRTRRGAKVRKQFLSSLMAIIFVFMLTGTAFAAEEDAPAIANTTQQTEDTTEASTETNGEETPKANPEEKWSLKPIGEQKVRIKKGQAYDDPGVVLLDEEGNVQYICLIDKVGVTVLDQMGNRCRDLEAGFMKIGTVANQYEGIYTLLYSFRDKITFRVVQVVKDLKELPEGKNAPADSLNFSLKLKGNYELVVKKGQVFKDEGVQVYDQYWKEHKDLESKVVKSALDMEKLGYQLLKYELNGKTVYGLVRIVDQSQKLTLKFDDKNVNSQNKMRVGVGSKIVLPQAKVLDASGKEQTELEKQIVVRGNFDTSKAGTYTMVYDLDGVQLTLTIEVVKDLRASNDDSGSSSSGDNWKPPHGGNDPGTDDPGTDDPGTDDPGTDDPGTDDPGTDDPGTDDPGTDDPGTDDPGTDDPGKNDPVTPAEPGDSDQTFDNTTPDEPSDSDQTFEDSKDQNNGKDQGAMQPPVVQPPVTETPVEQPPVAQPPVTETPVEQPPAEQQPEEEPPEDPSDGDITFTQ